MRNPGRPPPASTLFTVSSAWPVLESRGWLGGRSTEVREALRGIARVHALESGQYLYAAGSKPNGVFGLVEGAIDIGIPRADGEELIVHRADPGFWIGDLALFADQLRLVSVRAVTSSRFVHLPQERLLRLVQERPAVVNDFYELTHRNVRLTLQLLGNLSISPSDVRVANRLLLQLDNLPAGSEWVDMSQEELAGLVALSAPTLQRTLRRLENAGLIEVGYRQLRVPDRARLESLCNPGLAAIASADSPGR